MKKIYSYNTVKRAVILFLTLGFSLSSAFSQQVENSDLSIRKVKTIQANATRIDIDVNTSFMYYTTVDGFIYEVKNWSEGSPSEEQIATASDHEIITQLGGMTIHNGIMYIVGSTDSEDENDVMGIVKKATLSTRPLQWETVAKSDLYKKSNTAFDHRMNCVEVDPTGQYLFINSGSRTDHGEAHLGAREVPLTAKILRIPIGSENLQLKNEAIALAPYVYAEGIRNSFGLAWSSEGHLFGTENSGDRDHSEELNWLQEGKHYGFPWNLGGTDNPQQFPGYDPGISNGEWWDNPSKDAFIQAKAGEVAKTIGWVEGYFRDDPSFPQKPNDLMLIMPVRNDGPLADQYRDADDFEIKDGSVQNEPVYTFSAHLSPVGIAFDQNLTLREPYNGHGFIANYSVGGSMVEAFNDDGAGGSIMDVALVYDATSDNYIATTKPLATGFNAPIDVKLYKGKLFIIELGAEDVAGIWEIQFKETVTATAEETTISPTIDGVMDNTLYDNAEWFDLKYLHVDNVSGNQNTFPDLTDASGRYKAIWKDSKIYLAAEIIDDNLDYAPYDANGQPGQVFNGDVLEIFIDEDLSGGAHTKTHNAFAFHISPNGKVADQCGCGTAGDYDGSSGDWNARLFNDIVSSAWTNEGNKYTWEAAIEVHNDNYNEDVSDHNETLTTLQVGQVLGFGIGYNDYDGNGRDHLITSFPVPGDNNDTYGTPGGRNVGWQDASSFGYLKLLDNCNTEITLVADITSITMEAGYSSKISTNAVTATSTEGEVTFTGKLSNYQRASIIIDSQTGDFTLTETDPGEAQFDVIITATSGCAKRSVSIPVTISAGVPALSSDKEDAALQIFPVPTNNLLTATNAKWQTNTSVQVYIFQYDGKLVSSQKKLVDEKRRVELNTSELASGMYFLQVEMRSKISVTKFIKE